MKKIFAIVWVTLFCLTLCGCSLLFEKHTDVKPGAELIGDPKVFTGDGYAITLTDQFTEKKSLVGFDGYYVADFCGVMIQIITPSKVAEYDIENSKALLMQTIADNDTDSAGGVIEEDGLTYYHYLRGGNAGWNFAFKGSENYYMVQFVCLQTSAEALKDTVFTYAKSVKVE